MAIRFDASGKSLSRSRLAGAKTVMAWIYISTDRNDYTAFFGLAENEIVSTDSTGTRLLHWDGSLERLGTNLSTGTWYHLAYVSNGDSTSSAFTLYLNGASDISSGARSVATSGATMYLGNDPYGEWLNGRLAHVKIWSANLTQAEIQQEMYTIRPQRFSNLWCWMPTVETGGDRDAEWSGSGNTWTENGTLSDEANPPVSWGSLVWSVPFVAVGGSTQEIAPDTIGSSVTIHAPTIVPGAVTITPDTIESTESVYEPTVTTGAVGVTPDTIESTESVYEPTITTGAVTVAPDAIASMVKFYAPSIVPGARSFTPDTISSAAQVHEPTITPGAATISPNAITSTAQVYEPTVIATGILVPDTIASTAQVHEPTITPGAASIFPDTIASTVQFYEVAILVIAAGRIYRASEESRTSDVPSDNRTCTVTAESRTLVVEE